uniref:Membrane protein n=1 Tax=Cystobacter fuscus TaxID=43 RepID=A0A3S7UY35_9BACT|nr:membrane protein [Cystobacter fuscus]
MSSSLRRSSLPVLPVVFTGPGLNRLIAAACIVALVALAAGVWLQPGGQWRLSALALVGAGIGAVLLLSSFGFAGAFRALIQERDASGFRAHAAMLALASLLMLPMLAQGHLFGQAMRGDATPVGIGFAVGALLFGAGMQVGGGCASGTLYSLGGGNGKLLGTLLGFVLGSALGAWSMGFWWSLPSLPGVTLQGLIGFGPALVLQLAVLGLIWRLGRGAKAPSRLLVAGGLALALLNSATLLLAGKPWGETSAFALWGSKLFTAVGIDAHAWAYWQRPGFNTQLDRAASLDITSIMDVAILLGATLAAAGAGVFRPRWGGDLRAWAGALLGGVAMGFGARLSNGCNIGAYFSAISVGSLSGWAWAVLALAGSWMGIQLRPLFGLDPSGRRSWGRERPAPVGVQAG